MVSTALRFSATLFPVSIRHSRKRWLRNLAHIGQQPVNCVHHPTVGINQWPPIIIVIRPTHKEPPRAAARGLDLRHGLPPRWPLHSLRDLWCHIKDWRLEIARRNRNGLCTSAPERFRRFRVYGGIIVLALGWSCGGTYNISRRYIFSSRRLYRTFCFERLPFTSWPGTESER